MGIRQQPIVCIGGANIDHKFQALQPIHPGSSNPVKSLKSFGGVARNVAENLAHWTTHIHLLTAVGRDNEGRQLLEFMSSLGVNINHSLQLAEENTAQYYAVLSEFGELEVAYADMCIYDHIPIHDFIQEWSLLPQDSIIFLDTNFSTELIHFIINENHHQHFKLCIDPVSVAKCQKIPLRLDNVYLLKPNQSEASALTGITINCLNDAINAGQQLLKRGVSHVVISLGKEGQVLVNANETSMLPAKSVDNIKDVNGAGDAFIAGILYGLQQNYTIRQACEMGAAAAALTVQTHETVNHHIQASDLNNILHSQNIKEEKQHAAIF